MFFFPELLLMGDNWKSLILISERATSALLQAGSLSNVTQAYLEKLWFLRGSDNDKFMKPERFCTTSNISHLLNDTGIALRKTAFLLGSNPKYGSLDMSSFPSSSNIL